MTRNAATSCLFGILSFDMEHLLSLPCHVYWKDKKGTYLGYNDYGAKRLGFNQGKEVTGHSDFEIFPKSVAIGFTKNDQEATVQKRQIFIHEDGVLKNNLNEKMKVVFLSYKMPLFDHTESVVGVLGLSFTRSPESCCPSSQLEQDFNYYPPPTRQNKILSKMENACMRQLCRGLTIKQIAHHLKLSPKTVETYIGRVKIKFNCHNKAELIWTMISQFPE